MDNNCPNHIDQTKKTDRIEEDLRIVVQEIAEMKQNIALAQASLKSFHKRMDEEGSRLTILEQGREDIVRLASSIEKLAESIKQNNETIKDHDKRLNKVENSAGNFMIKVAQYGLFAVLGGIISFFLVHLGVGK